MNDYDNYIASKTLTFPDTGFEPAPWTAPMKPFQQMATGFALRKGKAALFEDTGLGKSRQAIEWALQVLSKTGLPVLILTKLAVCRQFVREGEAIGIQCTHIRGASEIKGPWIYVANYEKMDAFQEAGVFERLGGIVLDECFPPNTPVAVFQDGSILNKPIRDICEGDTIINAHGYDTVTECHRRRITRAVKISAGGRRITASENHPFFTQRGWVVALELEAGDRLLETGAAVCMVYDPIHAEASRGVGSEILRDILLSEMEDATDGSKGEDALGGSEAKSWGIHLQMEAIKRSSGTGGNAENPDTQPDEPSGSPRRSEPDIAEDEPQTFRSWWKWTRNDGGAEYSKGGPSVGMAGRVCCIVGETKDGIPDALQVRSRVARAENLHRGGWSVSPLSEGSGREEIRNACFVGVDSIEILEPGHPELEQWRDADGNIYFYDLKAARHPSFTVNGFLVHNSSILKNFTGKMSGNLRRWCAGIPYRLCATATPAPNDWDELGQHAEFLGVMSSAQMLATWFINDTGDTGTWRLKKHAKADFWRWVSTWAACIFRPSDVGDSDEGYDLPPLTVNEHRFSLPEDETGFDMDKGTLFDMTEVNVSNLKREGKRTLTARAEWVAAKIASEPHEPWCVFVETNDEADAIAEALETAKMDFKEVRGNDDEEDKAQWLYDFSTGVVKIMLTKSVIAGFGLNWQHCARVIFASPSFSFEKWYQAIRRFFRFGQLREVFCWMLRGENMERVADVWRKKMDQFDTMKQEMRAASAHLIGHTREGMECNTAIKKKEGENWTLYHGDCVRVARTLPAESIDFSVFSPPFADLFTYSSDVQDMGNCVNLDAFMVQFGFLIDELMRLTTPGRLCAVHCVDLLSTKWKDGYMGYKDFSGTITRAFMERGWILWNRITIWKCPVIEMTRTKAHGLLYKTLKKDSANSRVGSAEYMMVFKKPGENPKPINHRPEDLPVSLWQELASPVWMTVDQGNTLNGVRGQREARGGNDEKHICPLQLDVIRRALTLWSAPGDTVLSPFTGIGSEGHESILMGRKFVGAELKKEYFGQACKNLTAAEALMSQQLKFA